MKAKNLKELIERNEAIVRDFKNGMSIRELAKRHGVGEHQVYLVTKPLRDKARAERNRRVYQDYVRKRMSVPQLMERYGMCGDNIKTIIGKEHLRKRGVRRLLR